LFVKLSEVIDSTKSVHEQIKLLTLTLQNLVISTTYEIESEVLIAELASFGTAKDMLEMRRLKATVDRAMRMAKSFTKDIAESF